VFTGVPSQVLENTRWCGLSSVYVPSRLASVIHALSGTSKFIINYFKKCTVIHALTGTSKFIINYFKKCNQTIDHTVQIREEKLAKLCLAVLFNSYEISLDFLHEK
jgi:hypothetical protein